MSKIDQRQELLDKSIIFAVLILPVILYSKQIQQNINNVEQFEKQKEIYKKLEEQKNKKILHLNVKKPKIKEPDNSKCFITKQILENSITLISEKEKENIYKRYINQCNNISTLTNLINELTTLYIDKGYITSKVYLKPQDISKGIVTLHSIEGKLEKFTQESLSIKTAFWFQKNDYLNLRDLEVGIETLNRLQSNNATLKLLPGEKLGETIVEIENEKKSPLNGYLNFNNYGQETTGKIQGSALLNIDNPLGINDKITLNLNTTDKHNGTQNSVGNFYDYSFALGRLLYTFNYSKSKYKQSIKASSNTYESHGTNKSYNFNLNYKLFHNQNNKISLGSFVNNYRNENYIDDALIQTSTYNLSKAGLSIDHLYQSNTFLTYLSFEYTKGVHLFNYYNPTDLNERFEKYVVDLTFSKSFDFLKYDFSLHYQYSKDALFSVNQISIGGPYSVRGYNKEGLSGNSGYYYRNDLSYTDENKWFDVISPTYYVAVDGGWIKKDEDATSGTIIGSAVGMKLDYSTFSYNMYYAKPLKTSDVQKYKNFLGFQLSYRF